MQCLICMPSTRRGGTLDVSDRRLRLLDQAEADTEWDPLYEDILEQGKWRTVTHDNDLQGFARALHRRFDFDSSGCYKNARLVMQDNRYWENDRVQYVEGIGLSKHTLHASPATAG